MSGIRSTTVRSCSLKSHSTGTQTPERDGEKHCDELLRTIGIIPVRGWDSVYFDPKTKLLLSVYVDDFKLAGPEKELAPM